MTNDEQDTASRVELAAQDAALRAIYVKRVNGARKTLAQAVDEFVRCANNSNRTTNIYCNVDGKRVVAALEILMQDAANSAAAGRH